MYTYLTTKDDDGKDGIILSLVERRKKKSGCKYNISNFLNFLFIICNKSSKQSLFRYGQKNPLTHFRLKSIYYTQCK